MCTCAGCGKVILPVGPTGGPGVAGATGQTGATGPTGPTGPAGTCIILGESLLETVVSQNITLAPALPFNVGNFVNPTVGAKLRLIFEADIQSNGNGTYGIYANGILLPNTLRTYKSDITNQTEIRKLFIQTNYTVAGAVTLDVRITNLGDAAAAIAQSFSYLRVL